MIEFSNQIVVDRPISQVFGFVSDLRNVPKWNYYVLDVRKTSDGPLGEGTTFHQIRKSDEQDFRIVTYQPNRRITIQTIPPSTPKFEMRFTFEPEGSGTRITDEWKLDTGQPALLERLGAGRIKSAVLKNLGKLKTLLETGRVRLQDHRLITRLLQRHNLTFAAR
jgi:carbon monoxide dehydrogenase subunit G